MCARHTPELTTPDGPRSVLLSADTVFEDYEGNALNLSDLKEGQVIAVYGIFNGGGRGTMTAMRVIVLPPPSQCASSSD